MINAILGFSKQKRTMFLFCLFFLAFFLRLCAVFFFTALPAPKQEANKGNEDKTVAVNYDNSQNFNGINADYEYGIIARAIVNGKGYSAPIVEFDSDFTPKGVIAYRPTANQPP